MPCHAPLIGWRSRSRNVSGKRSVTFQYSDAYSDMPVNVPCGRCLGCRLEYGRQWAMRCLHEASLYDDNCFITLTYDDEHLPEYGSLVKKDFQDFMKRLRFEYGDKRIRFYASGEYGSRTNRPHYHALLFGFDFPDKKFWTVRGKFTVWRSDILEEKWPAGQSEVGSLTFESAAYCAKYMIKKYKNGDPEKVKKIYGEREAEFALMSRKPGIGKGWYEKYRCEVYPSDGVVVRGREVRPPSYYDRMEEAGNPVSMEAVKRKRQRMRKYEEERGSRDYDKEKNLEARLKLYAKEEL